MKTRIISGTAAMLALATAGLSAQPVITAQPTNQMVFYGSTTTFSVSVSGNGPFKYQWQFNGTNVPSIITTVAGNGSVGNCGDGGPATNVCLNLTGGVALDATGNLFIPDGMRIRKVDTNGIITTVAGRGSMGYSGDGGMATNAELEWPEAVALDSSGNLFIADTYNGRIRKVVSSGIITTVAGGGTNYPGDGGMATNATASAGDVAVDSTGNLFIAELSGGRIRKVVSSGIISTVAGGGTNYPGDGSMATNVGLSSPLHVALDVAGNLFIAHWDGIRKVDTSGLITTVAGNDSYGYSGDGGAATNASLREPYGLALDGTGNLFFADRFNNCIRKVDTNGIITTVAGNGTAGYSGDGGPAISASFNWPSGVAADGVGNLFIADNNRIRKVWLAGSPTLTLNYATEQNAGNYSVIVTSPSGSVTSSVATLAVVTQPQSSVVTNGNPASLNVSVSGALPLSFQWRKNGANLTDSGHISGSATTNLLFSTTTTNDMGRYTLVVSNACGSMISRIATLLVTVPLSIAAEPTNQIILAGGTARFSVAVSGTGPFTCRWLFNGTNLPNNIITTVAGGGDSFPYSGDGGSATNTGLNDPDDVATDAAGDFFIAEQGNGRIRKVDTGGIITTVAGGGSSGDGGPALNAYLNYPEGVALDGAGNLFIAEWEGYRIRKVDANGIITTVAGNGSHGYSGDDGPATNASLNQPVKVALDGTGNLFITDSGNNRIRKVDGNGIITTVAGNGIAAYSGDGGAATNASLNDPWGSLASDGAGNLFIADPSNARIRKVDIDGIISTVAGGGSSYTGDGGAATNASLREPYGVALDGTGNLFIADSDRIRKVDSHGIIATVAGGGTNYPGDGGLATNAGLFLPVSVAFDAFGNLFIADPYLRPRIRKVSFVSPTPTLALNNVTSGNAGNYALIITSPYSGSVTSSVATLTVAVPPNVRAFWQTNGTFRFNWAAVSNLTYHVQYTTNLTSTNWSTLGSPITATNSIAWASDVIAPDMPHFYRVMMLLPP